MVPTSFASIARSARRALRGAALGTLVAGCSATPSQPDAAPGGSARTDVAQSPPRGVETIAVGADVTGVAPPRTDRSAAPTDGVSGDRDPAVAGSGAAVMPGMPRPAPARPATTSLAVPSAASERRPVDPGAAAFVRRLADERPAGRWRLHLDGLVNQSRASTHDFEAMRAHLGRLLDDAARAMALCPFVVEAPTAGAPSLAADGAAQAPDVGCSLVGAAYVIDVPIGVEWELFLKLRCPGEPTWVAGQPIRLRIAPDGGSPSLMVPAAWRDAGSGRDRDVAR